MICSTIEGKQEEHHHVGCVGEDGCDVSDGGDAENDLPCNLSIHWNMTNASTRIALNTICLVIVARYCLTTSICIFDFFSYVSAISFEFMGFL